MLHERVTGTLLQHHKDLSERLEQLSLADDAFLQHASKLDASLCRPFAETRTYDPDVEGSSATLGDEIEKVQREAVELEKALDNMEKECQALQASEDEVFNRLLQHLQNLDPEGKLDTERRRIKKQGQKLEQQVLAELDEIQRVSPWLHYALRCVDVYRNSRRARPSSTAKSPRSSGDEHALVICCVLMGARYSRTF